MPERKEKSANQEKYQLTWSVSATLGSAGSPQSVSTDSYVAEESSIADEVASIERAEAAEEEPVVATSHYGSGGYPPMDEGYMGSFHSSPKKSRFTKPSMSMSPKEMRILALVAWSTVSAVGAGLIGVGPGSVMVFRFAVLGGVWAGVSALLWFLTSRLS